MNLPAPLSLRPERPPACLAPTSLPLLQPQWLLHPGPLHMPFCLPRATLPQAFTLTPHFLVLLPPPAQTSSCSPSHPYLSNQVHLLPICSAPDMEAAPEFFSAPNTQPISQIWPLSRPHLQPASSLGNSAPGGFQIDSCESAPQAILFIPGDLDVSG